MCRSCYMWLATTPSVAGQSRFCPVHSHNEVANKRDAATSLPQRLRARMVQYNVDFIRGDFNMSAFSTVGDVFSDTEFSAPGKSFLLPHRAASDPSGVVLACSNKSAAGQICGKLADAHQHHCYGCRYGGGVDRRHAAVTRCLADVMHSHNGTKVYIEQTIPALVLRIARSNTRAWILSLIKTAPPRSAQRFIICARASCRHFFRPLSWPLLTNEGL